ncbi:hypothetical protein [Microbacterium rhizosphaerae]|uniref:Uncharacterized protein n=1 Tax=Microbacterium rhizosphaerae TaxID=1678237 RepID=A0ABZ0SPQ1_9MICO|nr:hypothetical protein [Microbacterium rhizosphaerae]WPR90924.1 hypothetical protein SM116_06430 [Microbacterium rhizosphaerae]
MRAAELVTLGDLPWSEITVVDTGEVKPVTGNKAATLRITFDDESATLGSPIELIVRGEPLSQALDRILAARESNQEPHDR